MDRHDRPYKCPAEGCEKLPGFTYSGGLLRHEREVHNKHGGPRKQLNCPHPNCKRHTGKGFSRQENLNEHLRRVHTDTSLQDGELTEDDEDNKTGQKRKRSGLARGSSDDLREEMKRLKAENEELRRQSEAQNAQTNEMMRQIQQVRLPHLLDQRTAADNEEQLQQAQLQAQLQHSRMPPASML
jgi:seryl-tRNA synthetase